ncbi:MAG: aminotransferase class V-fold PLP-dependent enzyme [Candidatus Obscuribacterales bacterium]|nr:aminotransferase class V-fold PLP-dependent enzyme [Candidatus Obscuribacterales bacterium]
MYPQIDVVRARRETPGCTKVVHFNNAGASLTPTPVSQAVHEYLRCEELTGGYEAESLRAEQIDRFYQNAARLLNCQRDEVAFVESATRAWDMAFYSLQFAPGDRIITGHSEYASNYIAFLQTARKTGAIIDVIPNDERGQISVERLQSAITEKTKLIAITHVPTNGGLVNPAAEIGRIAKAARVLYLVDACQSVGQMPIDVEQIKCDILSCTGRKFLRGPRGTGILYMERSLVQRVEPVFLDLHAADWVERDHYTVRSDARRFETWECNYANKVGLSQAIDYALDWGLESIWARVSELASTLRNRLLEVPGIEVHDIGETKCGIVTFSHSNVGSGHIAEELSKLSINVSTSTPFGTRIDMDERGLSAIVRASVHYYNFEDEIEYFIQSLQKVVQP